MFMYTASGRERLSEESRNNMHFTFPFVFICKWLNLSPSKPKHTHTHAGSVNKT